MSLEVLHIDENVVKKEVLSNQQSGQAGTFGSGLGENTAEPETQQTFKLSWSESQTSTQEQEDGEYSPLARVLLAVILAILFWAFMVAGPAPDGAPVPCPPPQEGQCQ